MTTDLITRARAGDGDAFRELTEPHRRELQVHCYRMLGSLQDAEDALQDTLLAAWQGLGGFEGRASIRTWLYRIATNRCLNALRSASRRPAKEWDVPGVEPPEPTRLGEVVWLEPYPDALLEGAIDAPLGPEARYEQTEAISLAFVTALQVLPAAPARRAHPARRARIPRQRGGRHARLDRRVGHQRPQAGPRRPAAPPAAGAEREPPPAPGSPAEQALVARVRPRLRVRRRRRAGRPAHRRRLRLDAADARSSTRAATSWPASTRSVFGAGRRFDLVPTRANGQPAFGTYLRDPPAASATAPACSSSPSPATGSAP